MIMILFSAVVTLPEIILMANTSSPNKDKVGMWS